MEKLTIANALKKIRREMNMTQRALGQYCNINEVQIRQYEGGARIPSAQTINKIIYKLPYAYYIVEQENERTFLSNLYNYYGDVNDIVSPKIEIVAINENEIIESSVYYFNRFKDEAIIYNYYISEDRKQIIKLFENVYAEIQIRNDIYNWYHEQHPILNAEILTVTSNLNELGKQKVLDYVADISQLDKYKLKK